MKEQLTLDVQQTKKANSGFNPLDALVSCEICGKRLTEHNISRKEDGSYRKDVFGKLWCIDCTDKHDAIDWYEVYNS